MPAAAKIDLYKDFKDEYAAPKRPTLIKTKPGWYLSIEGRGEPGSAEFQTKIGALYAAAYTIKMASKKNGHDYGVCKLEAIWWTPGAKQCDFEKVPKNKWCWKLLIRTPKFIKAKQLSDAVESLRAKGKEPEVAEVGLESFGEGLCVQMLHVGPYDQERQTIAAMRDFAQAEGHSFNGPHHEIYLSDPRRVAPERLKTILREPVG